MTEPERWLKSRSGQERRLLLAALAEVPSPAAWKRASARFGQFGIACGASAASSTSIAPAAGTANASAVKSSGLLHSAFIKSMVVGLGIGSVIVVGSQLVQPAREASPPAAVLSGTNSPIQSPSTARPQTAGATGPTLPAPSADIRLRPRATVQVPRLQPQPGVTPLPEAESSEPSVATREFTPSDESPPAIASPRAEPGPIGKPSAPRALDREVSVIADARQALIRGDASVALRELAALDATGGFRVLAQEAALLRVEAFAATGQLEAAAAAARRLLMSGVAEAHRRRLEQLATVKKAE